MCLATAAVIAVAVGQIGQGIAKGNASHYQAQVARNNALIEQRNATYSASAGAAQAEQSGLRERSKLASLRASEAANGLNVNTGSAADVQESEHQIGRLDTETVSNNAALQTYGYESKATAQQGQAKLDQSESQWDYVSGVINAAGTLAGSPTIAGDLGASGGGSLAGGSPTVPSDYRWMQNASSDDQPSLGGGF